MMPRMRVRLGLFLVVFLSLGVGAGCQTTRPTPTPVMLTPSPVSELTTTPPVLPTPTTIPTMNAMPDVTVVVQWNEVMLAAIRSGKPRPVVVARQLYMVHAAMYDAWSLYDDVAVPILLDDFLRRPVGERNDENKRAAVSQAAYQMLIHFFPEYQRNTLAFSTLLSHLNYAPATEVGTTPAGVGFMAARAMIADRAGDGSNELGNYAGITSAIYPQPYAPVNAANPTAANAPGGAAFNPNRWQPLRVPTGALRDAALNPIVNNDDPGTYVDQVFLGPHWGAVRPFALTSGDQFRPPAPPQLGSGEPYTDGLGQTMTNDQAYRAQVAQVLAMSAQLTDEQKVIAEFWADGPRSDTPPGHWNALAHGVSYRDYHTLDDDVKMFLALNGALFDASISAWDAKRAYDYIRPISAIHHLYAGQIIEAWGGPNRGTQAIPASAWLPYQALDFVTPAFAEYISGHSTFSAAAAEVLTRFTGSNQFYDGVTVLYNEDFNRDGVPDLLGEYIASAGLPIGANKFENVPTHPVVLHWPTFQDAADQAGISRLYGGIHFQDGDLRGRAVGRQVGAQAYALAESYWGGARR